jgi:hypothetical protein
MIVRRRTAIAVVALAMAWLGGGCGTATGSAQDVQATSSSSASGEPVTRTEQIAGTWRVVSVGGAPAAERNGLSIRETPDGWRWGGPVDECHTSSGPAYVDSGTILLTADTPNPMTQCPPPGERARVGGMLLDAREARLRQAARPQLILSRAGQDLLVLELESTR